MISIMAKGWPGGSPVFQLARSGLPLVQGLLHGIHTGMCDKHDLTEQQWKILDPRARQAR
jgi:hypothetical protein